MLAAVRVEEKKKRKRGKRGKKEKKREVAQNECVIWVRSSWEGGRRTGCRGESRLREKDRVCEGGGKRLEKCSQRSRNIFGRGGERK